MTMATKGRIFFAARAPVCVLCFFMRAAAQAAAGNKSEWRVGGLVLNDVGFCFGFGSFLYAICEGRPAIRHSQKSCAST